MYVHIHTRGGTLSLRDGRMHCACVEKERERERDTRGKSGGILLLGRLAADRRRDKTRLTRKLTVISLHLFTLTRGR